MNSTNERALVHPRDEIMRTMERIYRNRMTTTSGGNLSIRDDSGDIWISPARVDKGNLTRRDIVCVRTDGSVDGPHRPSSEFPFHKAIYDRRPDVRAIVHAHPVALVAFSICRQTPDTRLFHQAHSVCGRTGFAPYAIPGSTELGQNIAATFGEGADSVILENHGVVVGGESLAAAFERFEAFEFAGKTVIKARHLGEIRYLTDGATRAGPEPVPATGRISPRRGDSRGKRVATPTLRVCTSRLPPAIVDQHRRKFFRSRRSAIVLDHAVPARSRDA